MMRSQIRLKKTTSNLALYSMLLPTLIYLAVFVFYPLVRGIPMSFQNFSFVGASKWVGLANYIKMFKDAEFWRAFQNTMYFALWNTVLGVVLPCALSIMLCEFKSPKLKSFTQTVLYLPNLFSWVVIGSTFMLLLSPTVGAVNYIIKLCGYEPIYFFGKTNIARPLILFINQWKITGFGIIIYLAALVSISPELFEAASIDGAGRFQKIRLITIPCLKNTVKVMIMLNVMGMFLLFDPIYVLGNPITLRETDVLMTYIYRTSITKMNLSYGATVSVFISLIALTATLIVKKISHFGLEEM